MFASTEEVETLKAQVARLEAILKTNEGTAHPLAIHSLQIHGLGESSTQSTTNEGFSASPLPLRVEQMAVEQGEF